LGGRARHQKKRTEQSGSSVYKRRHHTGRGGDLEGRSPLDYRIRSGAHIGVLQDTAVEKPVREKKSVDRKRQKLRKREEKRNEGAGRDDFIQAMKEDKRESENFFVHIED